MKHLISCLLFVTAMLSVSVCGRCDDKDKDNPPIAETRQLQIGDKWIYHVTRNRPMTRDVHIGNGSIPIRSNLRELVGTLTVQVVAVPEGNGPTRIALRENVKYKRDNEDVDRTWLVYFRQEGQDGIQSVVVDPKKDEPLAQLCIAGKWSDGLAYVSVPLIWIPQYTDYGEGLMSKVICQNTVAGIEKVSVKAGKYKTWKVSLASNVTADYGVITSENGWYAPEIGLPVKLVRSIGQAPINDLQDVHFSAKITETWELVDTNIGKDKLKK